MILNFWSAPATCGRYLAAQSEADHYKREMKREQEEIIAVPDTGIWMSHEQPFMKHCWQIPVILCVYDRHPDRWFWILDWSSRGCWNWRDHVAVWAWATRVWPCRRWAQEEPSSLARLHDEVWSLIPPFQQTRKLIFCTWKQMPMNPDDWWD